jgi:hypothetical protein
MYEYFKDDLLLMENYWYNEISEPMRDFYLQGNNLEEYQEASPDAYWALANLAAVLKIDRVKTITVNAITEYSTYCTSIVARNENNEIAHVRNLDFSATELMSKLIYIQVMVKDGVVVAEAPSIAGFYGTFTGQKPGVFSVSYNVRETVVHPSDDMILANLEHTLSSDYISLWSLI